MLVARGMEERNFFAAFQQGLPNHFCLGISCYPGDFGRQTLDFGVLDIQCHGVSIP